MNKRYRLAENRLRGIVHKAVRGVLKETRLDYDEDNFSGRYSRGPRYDIYSDGYCIYHDVSEYEVDILADEVEKKYGSVDVQCISGNEDNGYVDPEGYLDNPNDDDGLDSEYYYDFPTHEDAENEYSWGLFDGKATAPSAFGDYNVGGRGIDREVDDILTRHARDGQWSAGELRNGRRNMERWIQGRRSPEEIGDSWEQLKL